MYGCDTDVHNHVNRHVLRRITYMTCQTSHTYNTLPVQFSNLLPSSRVVAQIGSLLATLLYENQQYIKGIIVFMSKMSTLFVLTHHPCSRSSLPINFTSLAIISPISNENYVSITYVTLKAPSSEKSISWATHRANWLLLSNKLQILYFQEIIMCFNFVLSCNTFGLV